MSIVKFLPESSSSYSSSSESSVSSSSSVYEATVFEAAGETYTHPSLVVDILNHDELISNTKSCFGSSFSQNLGWVDEERLRGNILQDTVQWGFTKANGILANAVVLAGEKVVIHITTKGHGVGCYGVNPVFSKTKIRLTLFDAYRNVEKSIVFDSFSKPISDPSRYIMWQVGNTGSWSDKSRASSRICGLYVLKVTEESTFYSRADWTIPIELENGKVLPKSESFLQIAAYDWRDILGRIAIVPSKNVAVMQGAEFRTSPISADTTDDEIAIFDNKTVFPQYESINMNDEQKKVVVRDNAMVLLSSQGPVLPADAPSSPILGMGMTPIILPVNQDKDVSIRPAAEVEYNLDVKRTFSLSGKPTVTNVLDELKSFVSSHTQGEFVFFDPILALSFNSNGEVSQALNGGLDWILSGVRTQGLSIAAGNYVQSSILLDDKAYDINTDGDFISSSSSLSSESSSSLSSSSISSSSSELVCGTSWTAVGFDPVVGTDSLTYVINGTYTWYGDYYSSKRVFVKGACLLRKSFLSWEVVIPTSKGVYRVFSFYGTCPGYGIWSPINHSGTAGTMIRGEANSDSSQSSLEESSKSSSSQSSATSLSSASTSSSYSSQSSLSSESSEYDSWVCAGTACPFYTGWTLNNVHDYNSDNGIVYGVAYLNPSTYENELWLYSSSSYPTVPPFTHASLIAYGQTRGAYSPHGAFFTLEERNASGVTGQVGQVTLLGPPYGIIRYLTLTGSH